MARYTLKTFYGDKLLEVFEHRDPAKLSRIMDQNKHNQPDACDPWGESLKTANRFEVLNSARDKIHTGSAEETKQFIKNCR